jgi:hypothetical protein
MQRASAATTIKNLRQKLIYFRVLVTLVSFSAHGNVGRSMTLIARGKNFGTEVILHLVLHLLLYWLFRHLVAMMVRCLIEGGVLSLILAVRNF